MLMTPQPLRLQKSCPQLNSPYHTKNNTHHMQPPQHHNHNTQTKLINWLQTARMDPPTNINYITIPGNITNRTTNLTLSQRPSLTQTSQWPDIPDKDNNQTPAIPASQIQTLLMPLQDNNHWGNQGLHPWKSNFSHHFEECQLPIYKRQLPSVANRLAAMRELDAQVICFQETNFWWDDHNLCNIKQIIRK